MKRRKQTECDDGTPGLWPRRDRGTLFRCLAAERRGGHGERDSRRHKKSIEQIDAKYELLTRGTYLMNVGQDRLVVQRLDRKIPLELYEARNAIQLSEFAGADRYAAASFQIRPLACSGRPKMLVSVTSVGDRDCDAGAGSRADRGGRKADCASTSGRGADSQRSGSRAQRAKAGERASDGAIGIAKA